MSPPSVGPDPTTRDKQLRLTWSEPENEGDAIQSYVIKWNGGAKTVPPSTSTVISALENGVSYQFSIYAQNTAGPGTESARSDPEIPFGKPAQVDKPDVTPSEAGYNATIRVDWAAPDDNGDTITKYIVTCDHCHGGSYAVEGTSKTFTEADGISTGTSYTFSVAAVNRAGEGQRGPSESGMPYRPSDPVQNLRYVGSPADRTATISFEAPNDLGGLGLQYYEISGGGLVSPTRVNGAAPGGLNLTFSDNNYHSVVVRAVTQSGRTGLIAGQSRDLGDVETYGAPSEPSGTTYPNGFYNVVLSPQRGASDGPNPVTGLQYLNDDGAWADVGRSPITKDVKFGGDEGCRRFRTVSEATDARQYSAEKELCGPSTMREITVVKDERVTAAGTPCNTDAASVAECLSATYWTVKVTGRGFARPASGLAVSIRGQGMEGTCPTSASAGTDGDLVTIDTSGKCWLPTAQTVLANVDGATDTD
jgi:hypothetical protein